MCSLCIKCMRTFGICKNPAIRNTKNVLLMFLCLTLFASSLQAQTKPVVVNNTVEQQYNDEFSRTWLLKTNLLQLGVGIVNLGTEFSIDNKHSLDLPFTFTPYITYARNYKLSTLSFQPELRYWLKESLHGHFVGFHTHIAWYNIAINKRYRYQDEDGATPLLGFGVSYGYSLYKKGKWNFEFGLGFGYAILKYDVFYNVKNGPVFETKTKNYWGVTKAAVTLSYKLTK